MNWRPVLIVLLVASPASAADWPQFLGPTRNGVSTETGLVALWDKNGPPVLWSVPVGEGYGAPVIVGDRLILFHRQGDEEVVECLHAVMGATRWKHAYATRYRDDFGKGDGPRSTPTVADGRVYTLGPDGQLTCLELATGKKVWDRPLNDDYQVPRGFFGVATSPLVEGDLVLVNVGGRDAGIVALAKDTGKEVWKATNHEASYASPVAATIDGVRYVFFFTREGFVALDPKTGHIYFKEHFRSRMNASVNAASPVVAGNLVLFTASYGTGAILLRVKKDGFEEVWRRDDVLSSHYNTPIVHEGFLYGSDGRQESGARLRCIDLATAKVRWTREDFGCTSMLLADGKLILLTEAGDLVLAQPTPEAYRELARATVLSGPCRAELALANGRLYGRDNKKLVCWDVRKK
jgi:outer membrane protein assembly factor BamB